MGDLEIKVKIPDDKLNNFSANAILRIQSEAEQHTIDVIEEAENVEDIIREDGATKEITESIVYQAIRRTKTERIPKNRNWVLDAISEISILFVGIMFKTESFLTQEGKLDVYYLLLFLFILTVALLSTSFKYQNRR